MGTFAESAYVNPNVAPSMKTMRDYINEAEPQAMDSIGQATVVGQGSTSAFVQLAPNGGCEVSDTADYPLIFGFDTGVQKDVFNIDIPGSPGELAMKNVFTYALAPGDYTTFGAKGPKGRKLPYISYMFAGPGIVGVNTQDKQMPKYGTFARPDPHNPGATLPATVADAHVQGFEVEAFIQASDTLPAAGTGKQTTDTIPGYDHPVYNTAAIDFDPLTGAAYVKYNPDDLQLDAQGRLDLSETVKGELGGGGGGGSTGPGAAVYSMSNWAGTTVSGGREVSYNAMQSAPQHGVLPFDHLVSGDDVYRAYTGTAAPQGTFIVPADGGGDLLIQVQVQYDTLSVPNSGSWSTEYNLSVSQYRGDPAVVFSLHDWFVQQTEVHNVDDEQEWDYQEVALTVVVPATQPGDAIQVNLGIDPGGGAAVGGANAGLVMYDDASWISIAPMARSTAPLGIGCRISMDSHAGGGPAMGEGATPQGDIAVTDWNGVDFDTTSGSMYDPAHPSRLVAPADGLYIAAAGLAVDVFDNPWPTSGAPVLLPIKMSFHIHSTHGFGWFLAGTLGYAMPSVGGTSTVCLATSVPIQLGKDDYVELFSGAGYSDPTNPARWNNAGDEPCFFSLVKVG